MELESSWLVQRLQQPRGGITLPDGKVVDNPFSFGGGGYKNGGLSDTAMDALRGIWEFDYMGAAEFEFGSVPKALHAIARMAEAKELAQFQVPVETKNNCRPFGKDAIPGVVKGVVWGLCHKEAVDGVCARIKGWAFEEYGKDAPRTKERVGLERALREPTSPYRSVGWLELDNGFIFFVDHQMFEKTAELFGVIPRF